MPDGISSEFREWIASIFSNRCVGRLSSTLHGLLDGQVIDITTRQNIQLRGMPLEDGAEILKNLHALGQPLQTFPKESVIFGVPH